jgi:cyclopropane-fatty-acyl-phospholipid synthase
MERGYFRNRLEDILAKADVRINGDRAWDLKVHDARFFHRLFAEGSMGLGETYVEGWWDSTDLPGFFCRILGADLPRYFNTFRDRCICLLAFCYNFQKISRAFQVGKQHYDLGNDLYRQMLDHAMIYSCGYWKNAATLEEAQQAKLELTCNKLLLKPGQRLLDIGCGWGGLAKFAAERYGVSVVGVTVSEEQARWAREVCKGLPVEIRLMDYRALDEPFDRVVSIGMFEHVGYKNYHTFMQLVRRCLSKEGVFLLHTIGGNVTTNVIDPWIDKYIFPNAMLPSAKQIAIASERLFVMEDWHNFGPDYDKTLLAWFKNFDRAWPQLQAAYGDRFYRMWKYYLLSCAGSFRSRSSQLWQIVYSPMGIAGGYCAPH